MRAAFLSVRTPISHSYSTPLSSSAEWTAHANHVISSGLYQGTDAFGLTLEQCKTRCADGTWIILRKEPNDPDTYASGAAVAQSSTNAQGVVMREVTSYNQVAVEVTSGTFAVGSATIGSKDVNIVDFVKCFGR